MLLASLSNPTVKRLRLLHERRGRAQQGLFLVEGVRLLEEALEGGVQPDSILVAPAMLGATARGRALLQRLMHQRDLPPPLEVTPAVLRHVADTESPSGVVAALPLGPAHALAELPWRAGLALVLDGVQDPGNAGAIQRTAAATGVDAVAALAGGDALYAPNVVRAGMGAHFRLALAVDVDARELPSWLASRGQALLADAQATQSIYDVDLRVPTVLIVGSEAHGAVRAEALPDLRRAAIPMPGDMESLNVAVATAVILFEAVRQRRG
jgi:TrmH family RNA methyltransferase